MTDVANTYTTYRLFTLHLYAAGAHTTDNIAIYDYFYFLFVASTHNGRGVSKISGFFTYRIAS